MTTSVASAKNRATYRTVVLLRRSEKLKLERIASREKISSGEVIRRFIQLGDEILKREKEEATIEAAMKIISQAVYEANASMGRTIERIDQVHAELMKRDIP